MANPSNSWTEWTTMVAATLAVVGLSTIPLMQLDSFSRSILSPKSLQQKRSKSYQYQWEKETQRCLVQMLLSHNKGEVQFLSNEQEIREFLKNCMEDEKLQIVAIGIDESLKDRDPCVWILSSLQKKLFQIPLRKIVSFLQEAMESIVFTSTLCLVSDASGGLGSTIISQVLKASNSTVPILSEPVWIAQLAVLMEQKPYLLPLNVYKQCLMGLLRLQTYKYRKEATIVVTLPGQGTVSTLEPVLFDVFPHERHVFIYDSCCKAVARVLTHQLDRQQQTSSSTPFASKIRQTTPLDSSLTKQVPKLLTELQTLPLEAASITESWMTSINTYLQLKDGDKERRKLKKPEYLPFCCKLDNLRNEDLALENLLQFILGARSRVLPREMVQQATCALQKVWENNDIAAKINYENKIQDAVFCHKLILLENKTLLDTVVPSKQWSLKSTRKIMGCACCDPEEDEDEDVDPSKESIVPEQTQRPKFLDGKTTFAFDPTQF